MTIKTKFGTASLRSDGYYAISSEKEGNCKKLLHRLVFEDFYKTELPEDIIIHHEDENKTNNEIWNLIPMTKEEHVRLHHKGKIVSEETKERMGNAKRGENHPFYGKHLSEEHRRKQSEALLGEKNHNYGKSFSLDVRIKQSLAKNTTGILKVSVVKEPRNKQGFYYNYQYREDGKQKSIKSVDINKVKAEVLKRGLEWIVLDEKKAKECGLND